MLHWLTGGRVSEIVSQEAKRGRNAKKEKKDKDSLPLATEEDKFEKFCDAYKDFIDVTDSHDKFEANWKIQKAAAGPNVSSKETWVIRKALVNSFTFDLWMAFVSKLVWSVLVIFSIWFFVFEILKYIKAEDKSYVPFESYQFFLCAGFFLNMWLLSVGIQQMGVYSSILGSKVKAALTTAIYKKMIVRDPYNSKADIVALVAKDVEKLAEACLSLQYLWSGIFETVAVLVVLSIKLGTNILPGVAVMAVFLPLQYWMGIIVAYRKKKLSSISTQRTTLMEEILRSIKLIKIYGWEASFFQDLNNIREEERDLMAGINLIQAVVYGLIFSLPPMVSCAVFGTQEATGAIESVLVFTTLSFFNTLRVPFSKLPQESS